MQASYKDFASQERKYASWRINCLFFFISASHVTLWPWVPLMLWSAGCSLSEIGVIVFLLCIFTVFSVKLSLSSIARTKSGSVRRFTLLSSAGLSFIFGITALALTPTRMPEQFCSPVETGLKGVSETNFSSSIVHSEIRGKHIDTSEKGSWFPYNKTTEYATVQLDKATEKLMETEETLPLKEQINNNFLSTTEGVSNANHFNTRSQTHEEEIKKSKEWISKPYNINNNPKGMHVRNNGSNLNDEVHLRYQERINENINSDILNDNHEIFYNDEQNLPIEDNSKELPADIEPIHFKFNTDKDSTNYKQSLIPSHFDKLPSLDKTVHSGQRNHYRSKIIRNNDHFTKQLYNKFPNSRQTPRVHNSTRLISKRSANEILNEDLDMAAKVEHGLPRSTRMIMFGIASALIFSITAGGGLEIATNRLWQCYLHGTPDNNGHFDGLEYNAILSTSSPFSGDHKIWSSFTSLLWLLFTIMAVLLTCSVGMSVSPFRILCVFFFTAGFLKCLTLLIINVPYGNISIPKTSRALGLYLDNEVIEEGMRRITFHVWVFLSGIIISLPYFYTILLIQDVDASQKSIWVAQTTAISALILGEAVLLMGEPWLVRNMTIHGMMLVTGVLVAIQNLLLWEATSLWIIATSPLLVGMATSFLWLSVNINMQTLGTSEDQQKEAWISWTCFKCGMGLGSLTWALIADSIWCQFALRNVLRLSASLAITTSCVVAISALVCSRRKKNKRIYHTLDIVGNCDDDSDDSEINLNVDDWLVKRAKKEGFRL